MLLTQGLVYQNTPWEQHGGIWVKREDLCCAQGGPKFSKVRGLVDHFLKLRPKQPIGVLDTVHSKAGWAAAWVAKHLEMPCYNFHPGTVRRGQERSRSLGAHLISLQPGRSAILWYRARKILAEITEGEGYLLPNGLQLEESIDATAKEVREHTSKNLWGGTWIVSASTGTLARGVYEGLSGRAELVVHMGYSRAHSTLYKRIGSDIQLVDEGYSYKDAVDFPCPFPCNPFYDLKAWKWAIANLQTLRPPVVFWNIGS